MIGEWLALAVLVAVVLGLACAAVRRVKGQWRYRTADGSFWRCRRCKMPVLEDEDGPYCDCAQSPSPWEPEP